VGYGQLLEGDASIPAHRQNALRVIRRSGEHLSGLVDGLLDISMIEAGRLQIARDDVRLADFLGSISDMFRLQAQQQGLAYHFEAAPNLPAMVHMDEKRLRQVLINLLSNALRCTRQGSVALKVSYRSQVATFSIEDTGVGIAAEDLERIFQPFERIESVHHPARFGTGLGLTITKLFTEAMGGEISVQSTPGKGSCFRLKLMLSAITPRGEQATGLRAIRGYEGPRKTVLVVDDDPNHVTLMHDILDPLGFSVLLAGDGPTGLDHLENGAPDIALLDISLPGIDGWEIARRMREDMKSPLPIVMISANAWEDKYRNIASDFYNAYLIKPIQISALLECLNVLMGLKWIYDEPFSDVPTEPAARLDPLQIETLIELTSIGHIRGILDRLDEIVAAQPQSGSIVAHLRGLAEEVELAELGRVLKELSTHDLR
jgi:CheY-like chemotaxis protein/anti-sigma regulatory factor (Ser/Thr protein kinase)